MHPHPAQRHRRPRPLPPPRPRRLWRSADPPTPGPTRQQQLELDVRSSTTTEAMGDMAAEPFGPGCAAVPADGKGSFAGMATDPVATAASNNPLLSTLVTAVGEAGLGETLNTAQDITVFAPTNDAFAAVPKATLDAAMADPKGLLTKVLTNHVVGRSAEPGQARGRPQDAGRHDHHRRGLRRGLHRSARRR